MREGKRSWDLQSDSYKAFNIIAIDKIIIDADLIPGVSRFSEFKLDPSNMVVLVDKSRSQTKSFNSACVKGFDIASCSLALSSSRLLIHSHHRYHQKKDMTSGGEKLSDCGTDRIADDRFE